MLDGGGHGSERRRGGGGTESGMISVEVSGPLDPKLSMCFEGTQLTQLVQLVTAGRLFLGHKGRVNL